MDTSEDVVDMELKEILDAWSLGHLYEHFIEQKITIKVLEILQTQHIDKLFKNLPIGDQAQFENKLVIWKREILLKDNLHSTNVILNYPDQRQIQCSTQPLFSNPPTQAFNISSTSSSFNVLPRTVSTIKQPDQPVRYNVRQILEGEFEGQVLLTHYKKHKKFHKDQRKALIDIIARYIEVNGSGLTVAESTQLQTQIIRLFPTEKEDYYRQKSRGGRIYNRYTKFRYDSNQKKKM